jgi:predicted RNase H-like nuclease
VAIYNRGEVAADDIIDAMALAATAALGNKNLFSIPEVPLLDGRGIRMEINFWVP